MTEALSRRRFLQAAMLGIGGVAAAAVGTPIVAYLLSPFFRSPSDVWRDVGAIDSIQVGETTEISFEDPSPLAWAGQTAQASAWLRRTSDSEFVAFAVNCQHLGCPVSWLSDASLFMCPCHGGVYYADGTVAAGPPPRALRQYEVRTRAGRVELLTHGLELAPS
ncbi:MAG: ubiquinol-cytochrome c reductase iron-sulfur subunit [Dehalococcoidia bacterium]